MREIDNDATLKELRSIKLLLVMQLLSQGHKQKQLAVALGVSEATMSRMIPKEPAQRKKRVEETASDSSGN